jgi:hypothetical protein
VQAHIFLIAMKDRNSATMTQPVAHFACICATLALFSAIISPTKTHKILISNLLHYLPLLWPMDC